MTRIASLLLMACGIVAVSVSAQVVSVTKAPPVTSLDGADLYRARNVLRRFFSTERRPDCYLILFSQFQGNLRVDFVPKRSDSIPYEGQPQSETARTRCGRNVGYVIDQRGAVLRRIIRGKNYGDSALHWPSPGRGKRRPIGALAA